MALRMTRCPANPVVQPGGPWWRRAVTFNPGLLHDEDGFWLYERTAGGLRPFHCYIGLQHSTDGVHFELVSDEPVFTPAMAGCRHGSVQDARVVAIDGRYLMTYAYRPYAWNSNPTGVGTPESTEAHYPEFDGDPAKNQTRSGIAVSTDRVHWEHFGWATPAELDDRDVILFPEKIHGRYVLLRRPQQTLGVAWGTDRPSMFLCDSEDLQNWSDPVVLAEPEAAWEGDKIGGAAPPLRTDAGWLMLYHGVEVADEANRTVIYRAGAMLLDLDDPTKVIARMKSPLLEPEEYYERCGLYIPNVVFPTGNAIVDGVLHVYYGVCDTAIALATVPVDALLNELLNG